MKDHQHDVLLIYYKRKSGKPLTADEERAWAQYRDKYGLSDKAVFDEKKILELARLQQYIQPWDQFKLKDKEFPIAYPYDEKLTATVQVTRLMPSYWFGLTVAASLLIVLGLALLAISIGADESAVQTTTAHRSGWKSLQLPKGRQDSLVLADGTTVWLNAASSLLYPETFEKEARIVKLEKGEAYFDVTKQTPAQPFIVMIGDKRIQVLGTQFNVEAYDSATVTTTLIEGKVKLIAGGQQKILQPLQQAVMDANNITLTTGTNLNDVTAWKKGFFTYHDTRLSIIMEDLARWYDVDIDYKDPVKDVSFTISEYPRRDSLSGLLSDLEASKLVHFEVIGKKVIISNKKTK